MGSLERPGRRRVLTGIAAGLIGASVGVSTVSAESNEAVTVTLDNEGASAWLIQSADEDVGPTGVSNPTLSLTVGTRYRFENLGWSGHPLAFRDAADAPLLTQDGQGSFEDDAAVDWVDNGDDLAFTVTEALADELDNYVCTVHPAMEGTVEAEKADDPDDSDDADNTDPDDTDPDDSDEPDDQDDDDPDDTDDTDDDTDDTDDQDEPDDTDDDGAGFGLIAGLAGLGGVVASAYSRLGADAD